MSGFTARLNLDVRIYGTVEKKSTLDVRIYGTIESGCPDLRHSRKIKNRTPVVWLSEKDGQPEIGRSSFWIGRWRG